MKVGKGEKRIHDVHSPGTQSTTFHLVILYVFHASYPCDLSSGQYVVRGVVFLATTKALCCCSKNSYDPTLELALIEI